jgi:hypothetical protein
LRCDDGNPFLVSHEKVWVYLFRRSGGDQVVFQQPEVVSKPAEFAPEARKVGWDDTLWTSSTMSVSITTVERDYVAVARGG